MSLGGLCDTEEDGAGGNRVCEQRQASASGAKNLGVQRIVIYVRKDIYVFCDACIVYLIRHSAPRQIRPWFGPPAWICASRSSTINAFPMNLVIGESSTPGIIHHITPYPDCIYLHKHATPHAPLSFPASSQGTASNAASRPAERARHILRESATVHILGHMHV